MSWQNFLSIIAIIFLIIYIVVEEWLFFMAKKIADMRGRLIEKKRGWGVKKLVIDDVNIYLRKIEANEVSREERVFLIVAKISIVVEYLMVTLVACAMYMSYKNDL